MKHFLKIGIVFFGLLSLMAFLVSLYLARDLYKSTSGDAVSPRNYHFSLYLPDNRNSFFTGIIQGAEQAAAELNAAVSIHSIDPAKNELEMASYTGIDGAIVCPYLEDALARRQLDKLGNRQIPTVIINHDVPNDQPWPFIGSNNFDVGRRIGLMAGSISEGPLRLALVYSDKAPGIYGERELVEMGLNAALGERLAAPVLGLRTNLNPLDAEELLYRLFRANPDINTIVFTDPNDTLAAAQTLVDMNLVGQVHIIGFGDDPGILENIRKGVIACSVLTNPERIGYEAVRSLWSLQQTGYTPASIDTGIKIIDGSSL
ncbi:sugar ABC transporter substrate-binding protein [Treponema primitia]|uniref:sugar ABC transporter substrate-binding protein n=1 Tax=Treponema primitia TaxID=88058 RepID=UPI0002555501|nr:substrate-binding domain-containing protein [Treponema primitia]